MQKIQSKIIDRGSKLSDDEVDCNPDNKQITVAFLFSHGDHGIHLYQAKDHPTIRSGGTPRLAHTLVSKLNN